MSLLNVYANRDALRRMLGFRAADTSPDFDLDQVLQSVSRQIDQYCGRHFYTVYGSRTFTPKRSDFALIDDIPADSTNTVTVAVDQYGDRTYGTTWASTDFDLLPERAGNKSPPDPYWKIAAAPNGRYAFAGYAKSLRITTNWGPFRVLQRLATAAGVAITASVLTSSATSFTASTAPGSDRLGVGSAILIDSEQIGVIGLSGTTVTITRGLNGTTAAAHIAASAIDVFTYPVIDSACLLQSAELWRLKDTLGGEESSDEFGVLRSSHRFLLRVQQMLDRFRLPAVG